MDEVEYLFDLEILTSKNVFSATYDINVFGNSFESKISLFIFWHGSTDPV